MTLEYAAIGVSAGTVLLGAIAVIVSLRSIKAQLELQIFTEYTRRYSEIMDGLPLDVRSPKFDLESVDPEQRSAILRSIRRFFYLCSDEWFLHSKKKIPQDLWQIWLMGMQDSLRLPVFVQAWAILGGEYGFYPDFADFVRETMPEGAVVLIDRDAR